MTGAMILMFFGALLYGVVALMFLAFSCAELIDTGRSNRLRLTFAIAAAVFWPVALVVASLAAVMAARPARPSVEAGRSNGLTKTQRPSDQPLPAKRLAA